MPAGLNKEGTGYKVPQTVGAHDKLYAADKTNDDNWMGFEYARQCATAQGSGLGLALSTQASRPLLLLAIDVDFKRCTSPEQVQELRALIEATGTYAEESQSRNGLRAMLYVDGVPTCPQPGALGPVEVYWDAGYVVMTGYSLHEQPRAMKIITAQHAAAMVEHFAQRFKTEPAPATPGSYAGEVETVDPETQTHLRSALWTLPADDYKAWIDVGNALASLGDVGRSLWMAWSATSEKFDPGEAAGKWRSFAPRSISYRSIFHWAQDRGWANPTSKAAQVGAAPKAAPEQALPTDGRELLKRFCIDVTSTENTDVPDLVQDLIADEDVTLVGGHGGAGKSFLTTQTAIGAAAGAPVLEKAVPRRLRVMYYVAEDTKKRVIRRAQLIAASMKVDLAKLIREGWLVFIDATEFDPLYDETIERHDSDDGRRTFFNKVMGATVDYERLSSMVRAFDPDLLIVDGASDTFAGEVIKQRDVKAYLRLLMRLQPARRIGVAVLVHVDRNSARGNKSDDDGYIGAAAWHNSCRRRLYLVPELDKKRKPTNNLKLEVMKHQDGPPVEALNLFRSVETRGVLLPASAAPMGDLADKVQDADRLRRVVELVAKHCEKRDITTSFDRRNTNSPDKVLGADADYPKGLEKDELVHLLNVAVNRGLLRLERFFCPVGQRYKDRFKLPQVEA